VPSPSGGALRGNPQGGQRGVFDLTHFSVGIKVQAGLIYTFSGGVSLGSCDYLYVNLTSSEVSESQNKVPPFDLSTKDWLSPSV